MKRLVLPIIAALALLSSCNNSKGEDYDPFAIYLEWYKLTSAQNDLALDPFNVAYRLNVYLKAVAADPRQAETLRNRFFEGAQILTKDNKTYTISYTFRTGEVRRDLNRQGDVIVHTEGADLSTPGTTWTVTTTQARPYQVNLTNYGIIEQRLSTGSYMIRTTAADQWEVVTPNDGVYMRMTAMGLYSNWYVGVKITQVQGNQTPDALTDARFQVEILPGNENGGKNLYSSYFRYQILSPLLYQAQCTYLQKSGGEERIIPLDANTGSVGIDSVTYDRGNQWMCNPPYSVTAKLDGQTTTRYYQEKI